MCNQNKILVSIICCTYNHKDYISDAINGFICQEANFGYEIIIHDDCSTDGTSDIVASYAQKYPHLIHAIFEKENLYSKKIDFIREKMVPIARGKFIAFCEGDDFWIDKHKLQKQIDVLLGDSSISMCCHANNRINSKTKKVIDVMKSINNKDSFLSYKELLSTSNFPHLSSIIVKKNDFKSMPALYRNLPVGDYPLRAFCLTTGKVFYLNSIMSNYRVMSSSSWSKTQRFDYSYRYEMNQKMSSFLRRFDSVTNFIYHDFIDELIEKKDFNASVFCGRFKEARQMQQFEKSSFFIRMAVNLGIVFPRLITWLISLRSRIIHRDGR